MSVYINGTGIISAQSTFDKKFSFDKFKTFTGNRWQAEEPDYSEFIDGKQIRRMSRIIKMGIVASKLALNASGVVKPHAVIVGTAFGCLEDTYSFLSKLVQYQEDMLSPTAFIHSTHNTIAAQIALLFQSQGYNSTYVHRSLSFESALIDSMMMLNEGNVKNVLAGGIDEITDAGFNIMNRMGLFKTSSEITESNIYNLKTSGSVAGEGSAFFSLASTKSAHSTVEICAVETYSFLDTAEVAYCTKTILQEHKIVKPGLIITGHNGDVNNDDANDKFISLLNCDSSIFKYKHLCGEFATSTAFATWLAYEIIKQNKIPVDTGTAEINEQVKSILIYNQQEGKYHSIIVIKAC